MAWHCKPTGGYVSGNPVAYYPDSDGEDNCLAIWSVLQSLGWTATACAGFLACVALESGYNPWRWESDAIQSVAGVDAEQYYPSNLCHGYGLVQWTPASYENASYYAYKGVHANKYIKNPGAINKAGYGPNFSDQPGNNLDGQAQLLYLDDVGYQGEYFRSQDYPAIGNLAPYYSDYKSNTTLTPERLSDVWAVNFERSGNPFGQQTTRYNLAPLLYQLITGSPPPPPPPSGIPIWLLMKWREQQLHGKGYV